MMKLIEIDIKAVHESTHNPRRHFDAEKLRQLAANIAQVGILTPLTVRPAADSTPTAPSYEIGAGHRRYRAAKLAQLALVPCLVREMTDQAFMELLNIENLQHEGLHPLDEAKGYADLMAAPYKMKVETVAEKVGRSVKYIYDRIKLLALTKPARDLFWSGMIDAGHAILLARLTPTEQAKVIGMEKQEYADGGLFKPEHRLFLPDEDQGDEPHVKAVSVRELQAYIDEHVRFTGQHVDPMLFPETVAQITNATEMKRKIIEITHEYLAQDDVRHADKAKVYGERAWTRADGEEDSTVCDFAVLGVIASGPGRGQAFALCVRKDKCLVHWGTEIRAREKRAKDREQGNTAAVSKADRSADAARTRQNDDYERLKRKRAEWEKCAPTVLKAIDATLPSLSVKATGPLGDLLVKAFSDWGRAKTSIPRGKTADDLVRHLAGLALCRVATDYDAFEKFPKLAKHLGVDLTKILKPDQLGEEANREMGLPEGEDWGDK
jgi:ParB/RepB/Spo0J family partition protein